MKTFVGVTDGDWYQFLSQQPGIDEVNFWQPSGGNGFKVLGIGAPFLFKLHWPKNVIVGGGFFASYSRLPVSLVWDTFGVKNGAPTYAVMRSRIEKYRKIPPAPREDYEIGNIILQDPFFLSENNWIPAPADFKKNVVQGKGYDLAKPEGRSLWDQVLAARALSTHTTAERIVEIEGPMYGKAQLRPVRLHQGAFRVMVTDAYSRRCAISGEKALPVLEAAHIKPVAEGGLHRLDNGLLLRSDVHTLFDRGYISVTPDNRVLVAAGKLKKDYDNGEPYVPFHGTKILLPENESEQPSREQLEWHNDTVFRG